MVEHGLFLGGIGFGFGSEGVDTRLSVGGLTVLGCEDGDGRSRGSYNGKKGGDRVGLDDGEEFCDARLQLAHGHGEDIVGFGGCGGGCSIGHHRFCLELRRCFGCEKSHLKKDDGDDGRREIFDEQAYLVNGPSYDFDHFREGIDEEFEHSPAFIEFEDQSLKGRTEYGEGAFHIVAHLGGHIVEGILTIGHAVAQRLEFVGT